MAKIITRNAVRVLSKIKSLNYDNHLNVSQNLKKTSTISVSYIFTNETPNVLTSMFSSISIIIKL